MKKIIFWVAIAVICASISFFGTKLAKHATKAQVFDYKYLDTVVADDGVKYHAEPFVFYTDKNGKPIDTLAGCLMLVSERYATDDKVTWWTDSAGAYKTFVTKSVMIRGFVTNDTTFYDQYLRKLNMHNFIVWQWVIDGSVRRLKKE